jgi:type II secretory pathway component PulK
VLLMTIVLLALVATAAAGLASRSLQAAADAAQASEDLQRRWAELSCRAVLLPRAPRLLDGTAPGRPDAEPIVKLQRRIVLSGQAIDLVFTDEQAKANVNWLFGRQDTGRREHLVRRLLPVGADGSRVKLQPSSATAAAPGAPAAHENPFGSYGQLFDKAQPALLLGNLLTDLSGDADQLTCWGDGRLNVHRATSEALAAVCGPQLGPMEVARLLELRGQSPRLPLGRLLDQLALSHDDRRQVEDRLRDDSRCYGLWIVFQTPRRSWYSFAVADLSGSAGVSVMSFEW